MTSKRKPHRPRSHARRVAQNRVIAAAQAAHAEAEGLGPLVIQEPHARRVDGSPLLRDGEVYVTMTGKVYHPGWCRIIADKWDQGGTGRPRKDRGIYVARVHDIGKRAECLCCVEPLTHSRPTSTQSLDRRRAARDAKEAAARRRVNGG